MKKLFYFLIVLCGTVTMLDIYLTFKHSNVMLEIEKNIIMWNLIKKFGVEFAMLCRFSNTVIVATALYTLYECEKKLVSWSLITIWALQQIALAIYFLT